MKDKYSAFKTSSLEEYKACKGCMFKDVMSCPFEMFVYQREEETGKDAKFNYCVWNGMVRKYTEIILKDDKRRNNGYK